MYKLLTQEDLAKRWDVSVRCIEEYRKKGIITNIEAIPAIRFTPEHIAELEGVELERFSPLERKRMEREIEELKQENEKLKGTLANALAALAPIVKEVANE